jgi:acyl-[acyl-carrier-protein]-phospholipid O-acyltransferase/long-chain-fatty-acid--[acyl-carrier-protein] ligase
MKKPKWFPLFSMNFLTVFNDNLLKWLVCFISIKWITTVSESTIIAIASAMLVLPFIFLSPLAGKFSVKYEKKKVMTIGKIVEIPIMLLAACGFVLHSIYLVMAAVLLLGIQSSLFSPSKYGLIRDVGGDDGISFGTGTMEMLTFFGVLLGTFLASLISDHYSLTLIIFLLITVAILGLISTLSLKANESEPNKNYNESVNPIVFIRESFRKAQSIPGLNYVILGLSFFWLVGALLQMDLKVYCPNVLHLSNIETGIVMVVAAVGIGLGCFITGVISKNTVKIALVPIGAVGMIVFFSLIYFIHAGVITFCVFVFSTAFFSGMFKVPLNAWIQSNVKGRMLGDILAYENICEFGFILISSLLFYLFDPQTIFIVLFALTLFIGIILCIKIPGMKAIFKIS